MNRALRPRLLATVLAALLPLAAGAATRIVGAAEFRSWNAAHHYFEYATGFLHGLDDAGCLVAPLDLADGSILREFHGHFVDDDLGGDFGVELLRKRRGNLVAAESLATLVTAGSGSTLQSPADLSIANPVVDDAYVYYLATTLGCLDGPAHRLFDVVFELDESIFDDGFESGNPNAWSPSPIVASRWLSGASFRSSLEPGWTMEYDPDWNTATMPYDGCCEAPCMVAPVELPHGSTVLAVLADLYDDRSDRTLTLELKRAPMTTTAAPGVMAALSTSGASGWQLRSDGTIADAAIDNDSYSYYVEACVADGTTIGTVDLLTQAVQIVHQLP